MSLSAQRITAHLGSFIDKSPTPFHVVRNLRNELITRHGFVILSEQNSWESLLRPRGKYIVTRNGTSIAAFILGSLPVEESGLRIIGAHTDSPTLKLKPTPTYDRSGFVQLGVEPYGGPILSSWLNRDLGIAGRILIRDTITGAISSRLICLDSTVTIPALAIHLSKDSEEGVVTNKQLHLPPIIGLTDSNRSSAKRFVDMLKDEGKISASQEVIGFDLSLHDKSRSSVGGINNEFIHAPQLDNLLSCHAAMSALVELNNPRATCIAICYDNEETGSLSAQGAQSSFMRDILERIAPSEGSKIVAAKSFAISADAAHSVHPNYASKHDEHHSPVIGGGPVLKTNANQRYATNGVGAAIITSLCKAEEIKLQNFVARCDMPCGTTIGPISAARLGVQTVDIGSPILSMHSIREVAGVTDHFDMFRLMTAFYNTESINVVEE